MPRMGKDSLFSSMQQMVWKAFLIEWGVRPCEGWPQVAVEFPPLEIFKNSKGKHLSEMVYVYLIMLKTVATLDGLQQSLPDLFSII